jgi:ABC-type transport system involved in cytochrome bd biosynthesis fused ATPase/permease subunit
VVDELVLLAAAFALRGVLVWAVEVAGRRAASTVLSQLRMRLTTRRLRAQPAALDGVQAGEIAAVGVQGVDVLGAYFARCLPQVVLAVIVPAAVVVAVAVVDPLSALVMVATLPLVPVFMWLVGWHTSSTGPRPRPRPTRSPRSATATARQRWGRCA